MILHDKTPCNMLVYAVTEAEILNPAIAEASMLRIKEAGFESVYIEFRNVRAQMQGPRHLKAMAAIVKAAKKAGLYVSLEASHNNMDTDLRENAPEGFTDAIRMLRLEIQEGRVTVDLDSDISTLSFPFAAIAQIEDEKIISLEEIKLPSPEILIQGGGCAMTRHPGSSVARFTWEVSGRDSGTLLLITRKHYEYGFKDLGHPAVLERMSGVIASRLAVEPDELFWDEPHFGFAFYYGNGRAISDRLFEAFSQRFGYRLETRLPELWLDRVGSPTPSACVRLHYAELLETSLAELETAMLDAVKKFTPPGAKIQLGGHRTMHEELSDDILIGCADYFRHDAATTASYTDSVFEREDSMIAMAHLARSMAARQPGRDAWNMSWGFNPTQDHQHYYLRLLGAMNVRWIGHAWNNTMLFGPGLPHHPCWQTMPQDLAAHKQLIQELEGWTPAADTLVVYNWRALATLTGAHRNTHRRALLMLALTLTRQSVPFFIVSPEELSKFTSPEIRRIIVPWPDALPASTWDGLIAWAKQGGEVIFSGPPAEITAEGADASGYWRELTGTQHKGTGAFIQPGSQMSWDGESFTMNPGALVPNWDDSPLATLPEKWLAAELGLCGATALAQVEGKPVAASHLLGKGKVLSTSVDISLFPGVVERALQLNSQPNQPMRFKYRRGGEEKVLELPVPASSI